MLSFGAKIRDAQAGFFDRRAVLNQIDPKTRRALSRFGAFVRTRARSGIRKRRKISEPGRPPSSHTGLLKQFIYFSYDPAARSVVIGPAKLNRPGEAPRLLEEGGATNLRLRGRTFRAVYAPRPYMQPAFQTEIQKGTVKKLYQS